jgi:homocysteine S-methyltransferase
MNFVEAIRTEPFLLTEGALIERLRRDGAVALDPHVLHAGLVYSPPGREALRALYRQYLDIGEAAGLPMVVCAPTWRANPERLQRAGLADRDVNGDAVRFAVAVRAEYGDYAGRVFVGGLMGCAGDAYRPDEGLGRDEAAAFHHAQARALAEAGVDFLLGATLPHADEAQGMAAAMAACRVPYALSFVVKGDGRLLDGTPLDEAIAAIDAAVQPPPLFYMVNCVHPTVFEAALESSTRRSPDVAERVIGLQANASSRPPAELDGRTQLDADPPETLAEAMLRVHHRFGTRILGGCCGTDQRHIAQIARRVKEVARRVR